MDQTPPSATTSEAPRGIFSARVDEKGRLKLPAALKEYVAGFGEGKVFITSLDRRLARLYPISVWRSNEKVFDDFEDPEAAEDVAFNANDLGADCVMDEQGRVLVPQELRRELALENQPVWLEVYKGPVNIYSKEIYDERKRRASVNLPEKLSALKKKGLK